MGDGLIRAVLAYDVGPGIGLGHKRRMEALATALRQLGADTDLRPTVDVEPAQVLVVDSYRVRAERPNFDAGLLVAVDDLQRDLAADVVVDPNPGSSPSLQTAARRVLQGVDFALIGPIPDGLAVRDVGALASRVLVTTGASDEGATGAAIAAQIHDELPEAAVRLVVGPWSAQRMLAGVTAVEHPDGLWLELAAADVVVTAGGVTMLEACALGRPTVAVTLADNQQRAVLGAAAAGAVVAAEPDATADEVGCIVGKVVRDSTRRRELSLRAARWVDGQGPQRVAEVLLALV